MKSTILFIAVLLLSQMGLAGGFVPNKGQWADDFDFKADIPGGSIFLEDNALVFHLYDPEVLHQIHDRTAGPNPLMHYHAFRLTFQGANETVDYSVEDVHTEYLNFYLGSDASRWKNSIRAADQVRYHDLYDGIDLIVSYHGQTLKYEFHVAPGVDPNVIQIEAEGLDDLSIDGEGNLILETSLQNLAELKPRIFQEGKRKTYDIDGGFQLKGNTISYSIGDYDTSLPLIIDPEVIFSTYSGSDSDNWGHTAAPDNNGYLYTGGIVFGNNYPVTSGAYDETFNSGQYDIAITKYDTTGESQMYSTYLGGSEVEHPHSLIVDAQDNLYVLGSTGSSNFPTTSGSIDESFNGGINLSISSLSFTNGSDLFVSRFNSDGTGLLASTFLGGTHNDGLNLETDLVYNYSDEFRGEINTDLDGNIYIASSTFSQNFPVTSGSFDANYAGGQDGVVMKLDPTLSSIIWSGFIGGSNQEAAYGIDVASDGSVYVSGGTSSNNFPATTGALYANFQGGRSDGFIAHIDEDGADILEATYYGESEYDQIYFIKLDRSDRPCFFGQTEHAGSGLIFNAGWNDVGGGQIIGVLDSDLSDRVWTSQFGSEPGQPNISPTAFLVDVCNSMYISGWGGALNVSLGNNNASDVGGLQVTSDAFQSTPDNNNSDFYLAVITSDGGTLEFGSFYGGHQTGDHVDGGTSRFDRGGQIYHSVCASCGGFDDFPIEPPGTAWSNSNNAFNCNNAVFKMDFELPIVVSNFYTPTFGCAPLTITFDNNSVLQSNSSFYWDFGDGTTSTQANPTRTFTEKGTYLIKLVVTDPTSCNLADTFFREVVVKVDTSYTLPSIDTCLGLPVVLGPNPADYGDVGDANLSWQPVDVLNNTTILNPTATIEESTLFRLVIDYGECQERILQQVNIDVYDVNTTNDTIVCSDFTPFTLTADAPNDTVTFEWSDVPSFSNIISTTAALSITELNKALNYFYVRTTKTNGCQMLDTVLVTVSDLDFELTSDTVFCKNQPSRVEAISNNPKNTFDYYWSLDGYTTDTNEVIAGLDQSYLDISIDTETTYYVVAESKKVNGCVTQDSVTVQVSNLDFLLVEAYAEQDSFYRGELIQLHGSPTNHTHFWTPDLYMTDAQSPDPQVRPKEQTSYIWSVTDEDYPQCSFKDTVTLYPYDVVCGDTTIFVPSAFSPDFDGINDELFVRGDNIKEMKLEIYDRWGTKVFTSNSQKVGWDGTYKGEYVDPVVYNYQLTVTCVTDRTYFTKGNLTVRR